MERVFIGATRVEATPTADEWWGRQRDCAKLSYEVAVGRKASDIPLDQWAITIRYEDEGRNDN